MLLRQSRAAAALLIIALLHAAPGGAQPLPSEPIVIGGGRLVIGGDLSTSIAARDPGFFNYTDYEHNALRMLRLGLSASLDLGARVALLGELRTENETVRPYALYVRVRPWPLRAFDLQAGRIPPTFGAFARRGYATGNPLVGYPLAYQYLTSLRADALPANADDLLRMRGRGWLARYPVGSTYEDRGVPLVSAFRWDTGVQARYETGPIELSGSVTNGTLSNPRVADDNGGKQASGRLVWRPSPAVIVGASAAHGAFLAREARDALPPDARDRRSTQRAFGADIEYSRGYWLVRAEAITSAWTLPAVAAPWLAQPLRATALSVEGQYKLLPGLYVASRADGLTFSRIVGSRTDPTGQTWDAPIGRIEVGGGYYVQRNLILKVAYQHNWRDGGRVRRLGFAAAQLLYWF